MVPTPVARNPNAVPGHASGTRSAGQNSPHAANTLEHRVDAFIREADSFDPRQAEEQILPLLVETMALQGFRLESRVRPEQNATDYVGVAAPDGPHVGRVGVEYKHYTSARRADVLAVDQVARLARAANLDKVLLVSKSGFTRSARAEAAHRHPLSLELLTLDDLRTLATAASPTPTSEARISAIVREMSEEMARAVARDPAALDYLEWRDLERMVHAVLQGLGFDAELTPGSKDGGKDIIVRLTEGALTRSFAVELKHWRSGKGVGVDAVRDFVSVVAREQHESGLFLSTSGYTTALTAALTEIERQRVRLGSENKVVNLCRTWVRSEGTLWQQVDGASLPELLFSDTD